MAIGLLVAICSISEMTNIYIFSIDFRAWRSQQDKSFQIKDQTLGLPCTEKYSDGLETVIDCWFVLTVMANIGSVTHVAFNMSSGTDLAGMLRSRQCYCIKKQGAIERHITISF